MADRKLYLADRHKKFSIRQIEQIDQIDKLPPTRVPEYREIFLSVANEMQWQMENSTCRIVQNFLYPPNRTNRSNRTSVFSDRI